MSPPRKQLYDILDTLVQFAQLNFSENVDVDDYEQDLAPIVTGIKMLGEELQEKIISRNYLDAILRSIKEMLFTLTPERTIKFVNNSVVETLGYAFKDLEGLVFDELWDKEDASDLSIGKNIITKTGMLIPVIESHSNILNEDGSVFEIIYVVRDITDIKTVEKQLKETTTRLIHSEKLTALGELAAGVAHELNQPLNAINIIGGRTLRELQKNRFEIADLEGRLVDISGQVKKMAGIIDHMRIFTRVSDGLEYEKIDLSTVCNSALKFFREQLKVRNIELVEELTELPYILGNQLRLEQVIVNLITNARKSLEKADKEYKQIRIRTYRGSESEDVQGSGKVVLELSDNGDGVPQKLENKIFEPFFTTTAPGEGTGLGLSITKKIIEEHSGTITLINRIGKGATFRIVLPV